MADLLIGCAEPAAKAGRELRVVLAGVEAAAHVGDDGATSGMMALEDLHAGPGGRHSNDHHYYR